jgi:spermidine synthase
MSEALNRSRALRTVLPGIFLISFSSLMLQVTITRIFSVTIWYHYAFVAVSVALFGWGLGGIFLHFRGQQTSDKSISTAATSSLIFAFSIQACLLIVVWISLPISFFVVYYALSMIPFFIGGFSSALLFRSFSGLASKLYFADLLGASLGCLFVEPFMNYVGPESTGLLLGITATLASLLLSFSAQKRKRIVALSIIGLIVTSSVFLASTSPGNVSFLNSQTKSMYQVLESESQLKVVSTKWNSFSRIDVVERWPNAPNTLSFIYIDADAATEVMKWDGNIQDADFLRETADFLPYTIKKPGNTLIIGSGGGRDIAIAMVAGSSQITAVELNPLIVDAVRSYGATTGNVYDNEKVRVVIDEGRSFISRSKEKYDVIVLTMVDSWAAISAGGYALSENYLYTEEAFHQYIDHLNDDGILLMIRWYDEIPRLVCSVIQAFVSKGSTLEEAGNHIVVTLDAVSPYGYEVNKVVMLVKKSEFTSAELKGIEDKMQENPNWRLFYDTNFSADPIYANLFNGTMTVEDFYESFPKKIYPVTDNDPYYFATEIPLPTNLRDLIFWFSVLVAGFIFVPWLFRKQSSKTSGALPFVLYFSALGMGFMLVEVVFMQKFILFLGYPTRALSVTLFSLLLSSGIGSFASSFVNRRKIARFILYGCSLIVVLVLIYYIFIPQVFASFLQLEAAERAIISFVFIFPLGFLMGIPFPSGLRMLGEKSGNEVPWMWAINGGFSVFGAIIATAIGIIWGLNYALFIGAISYFAALLCGWRFAKLQ